MFCRLNTFERMTPIVRRMEKLSVKCSILSHFFHLATKALELDSNPLVIYAKLRYQISNLSDKKLFFLVLKNLLLFLHVINVKSFKCVWTKI